MTLAVLLSKVKNTGEIEYSPVYFNSLTKTLINFDYKLDQSFQEIIYRLDSWISNRSGWIVIEIYSQYLNISSYLPLSGSTYIKLPIELRHPMKGLINIQNSDNKCFLWGHVRNLNCVDKNQQRITKKDGEVFKKLNFEGVNFPVSKKDYRKIEVLNKINIDVFCYENKTVYPVYLSDRKFDDFMDLLFVIVICILKILSNLCLIKQSTKDFENIVYSVLAEKKC